MLCKGTGRLYGFKWVGDDGAVLVAVGDIDEPNRRNDPWFVVTTMTLTHNQRLLGLKTASCFKKYTEHYSF